MLLRFAFSAFAAIAAAASPTPCPGGSGATETAVAAGTRLRAEPEAGARSLAVLDADVTLPVQTWCGAWAEVRWQGLRGWVRAGDTEGPSLERAARPADEARFERARAAMRPLGREGRLGPWRLVTEAAAGELTGLDAVASRVADAYRERTGLSAEPGPGQAIAIFASSTRYDAFAAADGTPFAGTRGHAGGGLAAFAMARNPLETRVLLVHELTHLLSRNAISEAPPPWLDEGLSEDLAWCRVDADGRLRPGTLDEFETGSRTKPGLRERSGPAVTVEEWLSAARRGRSFPLAALLAPDSRFFQDAGTRRDASTASALLVRWCLAEPARARRFRTFLRGVSLGGSSGLGALAEALATEPAALQRDFLAWARTL